MSAAGDHLSAAAQHLPDVEQRRCWSIRLAWKRLPSLIPPPYAKRPEKRWLCTRRSSFCWEKRVDVEALLFVLAPFRTEAVLTVLHRNDPPWPRLDSEVSNSPLRATRSCALCNDQILESWMNVACACDETRPWLRRDRSRKRAQTQWARMPFILKRNLKLLGGFIGNGDPPPPPPPCVRAWLFYGWLDSLNIIIRGILMVICWRRQIQPARQRTTLRRIVLPWQNSWLLR